MSTTMSAVETFLSKVPAFLLVSGALNAVSVFTVAMVLLLAALIIVYFRVANTPKNDMTKIPGPGVNPITMMVIPLLNIYRNSTITASALYFQIVCGYTHIFDKCRLLKATIGVKNVVVLFKPDTVEKVLNSHTLIDKSFPYTLVNPWLKEGLLNSTGQKWRNRRKLLTPSFHFRILDGFFPIFEEQSRILIDKIDRMMREDKWIGLGPVISLCTLDIICETAMGKNLGAQKGSKCLYIEALHRLCVGFTKRLLSPWLWYDMIFYRTQLGIEFKKDLEVMDNFTRQVVKERKEEMERELKSGEENREETGSFKKRKALLDLMLSMHLEDNSLTLEDIAEEVDNFMFAGHDTTATGLNWTLYEIGLLPHVQKKLHEEIDSVFGEDNERPVTADDLKKMVYLDWVLKEARRLHPPTPAITRQLCEDTVINDYLVAKGTICVIFIYMLHRNTEVFPNPEVFDPERFRPENVTGRHPFAYVPFSGGPRNCIGQRFALFEAKVVITNILRHYTLRSLDHRDKVLSIAEVILRSEYPQRVEFKKRGNWKKAVLHG